MKLQGKVEWLVAAAFAAFAFFVLTVCVGDLAVEEGGDPLVEENRIVVTRHDTETEGGEDAEYINLSYMEEGGVVRICRGGDYHLAGNTSSMILVDAYEDEVVHLFLDGMSVSTKGCPAIYVAGAAKLVLTASKGTSNMLADSSRYEEEYGDLDGCIYAVCDITVNGDGHMKVYGYNGDAIHSKDCVKVVGAKLDIWAKKDGILGNDGVLVAGGRVTVQAEGNGLRTRNSANDKGNIEMTGGEVSVLAGKNGILSAADILVLSGECSVNSVREKFHAKGTVVPARSGMEETGE